MFFFSLFSISAEDRSSSPSLLSTFHPQPVISGGVTPSDLPLSSHSPLPLSEPCLTLLLWLFVRTNLSSSFDNKCWIQAVKHPHLQLVRIRGYSTILVEAQAETLKQRTDLLTQSLVYNYILMTLPRLPLSLFLSHASHSSTLPLSPHSLLSLSAVTFIVFSPFVLSR